MEKLEEKRVSNKKGKRIIITCYTKINDPEIRIGRKIINSVEVDKN